MKHKFRKRIERLEQIVNPKLYFNSLIIFDPKKPIPPRPPNEGSYSQMWCMGA